MSLISGIVIGLLMGVVFGFAFEKSRMMEPGALIGQFQFRRFVMMKMLFAAVATSLVVLAVLHGFGFVKLSVKAAMVGNMVVRARPQPNSAQATRIPGRPSSAA